jgi:hypothetical protein
VVHLIITLAVFTAFCTTKNRKKERPRVTLNNESKAFWAWEFTLEFRGPVYRKIGDGSRLSGFTTPSLTISLSGFLESTITNSPYMDQKEKQISCNGVTASRSYGW